MKEKPIYEQLGYDPDPPFSTSTPVRTNYDEFRAMSIEELAKWIFENIACPRCEAIHNGHRPCLEILSISCEGHWLAWLQRQVTPDA